MNNITNHFKIIIFFICYLLTNEITAQLTDNTPLTIKKNEKFADKKFSISLNAVYAFRYEIDGDISLNDQMNDINKQASHNFGWCADAHLALDKKRRFYLGFQYGMVQSDCGVNSMNFSNLSSTKNYFGDLTLKTSIKYFGINSMIAIAKKDIRRCFYFTCGLNILKYNEELNIEQYRLTAHQNTVGISYGFKYDKRLNKNIGLTTGIVMDKGLFTTFLLEENGVGYSASFREGDEYSIARITFSVGARFYFGSKKKEITM